MLVALNNHIIMITTPHLLHSLSFFTIHLLFSSIFALNLDGLTLLSFKHTLLSHQPSLLQNWNQSHLTPCSWSGVTCTPKNGPVTGLSLPNARLSGPIPNGLANLRHLRVLDLSNNSINGTLPLVFNEANLNYLNLSHNEISGSVFSEFAKQIPEIAVVDLSFNNFTGEIPRMLSNQKPEYFAGNLNLCGKPLTKICTVPSSHSLPPNVSLDSSTTAAIAAIPKSIGELNNNNNDNNNNNRIGPKGNSWKIVAIVVGDAASVVVLVVIFYHAYQFRKKKTTKKFVGSSDFHGSKASRFCFSGATETESPETKCLCFRNPTETETSASPVTICFFFCIPGTEASDVSTESDSVDIINNNKNSLVMVDGETEMDMDTLLKSSAYILGSSGGSIVYKIVVSREGGGMALVARRLADCGVERMKDFEKIVRGLSKLRHRNLVKIRGFYWGEEEKLVIYDYVSGGSLAGVAYEKVGPSSCHLSFDIRLKIAKGIAKGLSYIHEKKHVHGNMKPNNILLTHEMDPVISDFGLEWLMSGKTSYIFDKSTLNFGSKRSTSSCGETNISRDHNYHFRHHYQAPEAMTTLKSNPKWDVYSFGVILLELFSGKVLSDKELALWNMEYSVVDDMDTRILRISDQFITTLDMHGRKDCVVTCLKLGFSCASLVPRKRPSMKEALQELEKIPCPS